MNKKPDKASSTSSSFLQRNFSLRTKLIFGNMLITCLSLAAMGYFTFSIYLVLAILAGSLIGSIAIANMFIASLGALTRVAEEITNGNLGATAEVTSQDEIGSLANAINTMTLTLRNLIGTLEQHVDERTITLKERSDQLEMITTQTQQRANQLQAVAQVASAITSVQSLEDLLPKIASVISAQFGFYHVAIFILDQAKEYAVLSAVSSDGGRKMLAHGHQLKVGETGIVGYVAGSGKPRIALDTGKDAVFFSNPDLPETRSEMALPLQGGTEIIGVLDVQSEKPSAFSSNDDEILTILADQVSIAIQNAQRFQETQKSIADAQALSRQYIRHEWQSIAEENTIGYRFSKDGIIPIMKSSAPAFASESDEPQEKLNKIMVIPIKLHDQTIGFLKLCPNKERILNQDLIDISKAVADRVALAVENARLLESSQAQAARERTVGEITSKIGSSVNMRNVLQTAVEELGRILPGSDVVIQMETSRSKD